MKYGIGRMQNKIYYNKESNKDKFLDGKCVLLMILNKMMIEGEIRKLYDTVDRDDSSRDRKKE